LTTFPNIEKKVENVMLKPSGISVFSVSVYLFPIRGTRERRRKKKSNYLHSHGEEAQKKQAGL